MGKAKIPSGLTLERAEHMAIRHNAHLAAKYPLLASGGLINKTSGEQILAGFERWEESRKELRVRQETLAARCRRVVARKVGPQELVRLDRRPAALPQSSEYRADFWRNQLAQLVGRSADGGRQAKSRFQQK